MDEALTESHRTYGWWLAELKVGEVRYLLTNYPVDREELYARLSCLSLNETALEMRKPFICSTLTEFEVCLSDSFSPAEIRDIAVLLDSGETVHRLIDDWEARATGFIAQIH